MLLFTWNLGKSEEAFRLALSYLRTSGFSFIASLQELPKQVATTTLARAATSSLVGADVRCLGVTPTGAGHEHGRVGLFCSATLDSDGTDVDRDQRQRMAIAVVNGTRVGPILVVGYHGESRQTANAEYSRGSIGTRARMEVDRRAAPGLPIVMLGDFNANPFDPEVCGSEGLFAVRDRADAMKARASPLVPLGDTQQPLYNVMWPLLAERHDNAPPGTHLHDHRLSLRWRLYDQIVVSSDLIRHLGSRPEILRAIQGRELLTSEGAPADVSDHLPVQIRVNI